MQGGSSAVGGLRPKGHEAWSLTRGGLQPGEAHRRTNPSESKCQAPGGLCCRTDLYEPALSTTPWANPLTALDASLLVHNTERRCAPRGAGRGGAPIRGTSKSAVGRRGVSAGSVGVRSRGGATTPGAGAWGGDA